MLEREGEGGREGGRELCMTRKILNHAIISVCVLVTTGCVCVCIFCLCVHVCVVEVGMTPLGHKWSLKFKSYVKLGYIGH